MQTILGANGTIGKILAKELIQYTDRVRLVSRNPKLSILHKWMLHPLGLLIPVMKEMHEMIYQYERDYFFDSSKFTRRFGIKATTYEDGIKATCNAYRTKI